MPMLIHIKQQKAFMFVIGYQNPILKTWSTFFRKAKAVLQLLFKHLIGLWALDILHF
jgi:hypothetical protein